MSIKNPVKTLGILGGGQLGRMSAQAAEKLNIDVVIFTPEEDSPAAQVAGGTIVAAYEDKTALKAFADKVDVITYEFENIPLESIRFLKKLKPVYPDENLLAVAQDRIAEKTYLNDIGIPTADWLEINGPEDIEKAREKFASRGLILKTVRFGYDGKGQMRLGTDDDAAQAWQSFGQNILIAEALIDFECEISVIIARDHNGKTATYGPVLNEHKNHILDRTTVPAPITPELAERAQAKTLKLAGKLDLRGVLALEMFVTKNGQILANEIAPRTHNSGHWSIDACAVSQFENHVRAVCGLDVLDPGRHSDAEMINLIGDDVSDVQRYENQENACLHLYGKHDIKPGRKMGHVTILKEKS